MEILSSIFYKIIESVNFYLFSGKSFKIRKLAKKNNGDSIYSSATMFSGTYVKVIFHDIKDYRNFIKDILLNPEYIDNWEFFSVNVLENNNIVAMFDCSYNKSVNEELKRKYIEIALSSLELFSDIIDNNSVLDIKVENNTVSAPNGYTYSVNKLNKVVTIYNGDKKFNVRDESYCCLSNSCFEALKLILKNISYQNKILYNIDLDLDNLKSFK